MSVVIARWAKLSPLLDELLDLDAPARAARLQALRQQDAELADELDALLRRDEALSLQGDFLASPAPISRPGAVAGQVLGAYRLERPIGQGGMGSVWLAQRTDGRFEGQVAIKFLHAGLLGRSGASRFAREGQILARLAHPNIARLIDAGVASDSGAPYLVLDYVDGLPITDYCAQHQLDVTARLRLMLDVLAAVAHAHNRLILHRDLKPSNILVSATGEVKLLDFGIAKLLVDASATTHTLADQPTQVELTQQVGNAYTLNYAAPEQLQGGEVSTATDVYALGVLMYLLLSGQHPTAGAAGITALERLRLLLENEPKPVSEQVRSSDARRARELRGDVDTIVARALKSAPAERYANAAALADDVRRWLAHEPIKARPDSTGYRIARFTRRHRLGVVAGGLAALALGTSIGVGIVEARATERQRVQAEGLIEFMLGDLRKKLEPVGRLDVMDSVGAQALTFYAQQDAGALDAGSLGRRARALHLLGEVAEKRGNLGEAARLFREAAGSTAELLARSPGDGQRVFDHSQSVYWVGFAAWRSGQAPEAALQFSHYLRLAQQLAQIAPDNLDWRAEEAFARQNLGLLALESGRAEAALASYQASDAIWLQLVKARPDFYLELANNLGWVSRAQMSLGRYELAIAAEQNKLAALHQLPNAQANREVQALQANAAHEVSRLNVYQGQTALALQWAQRAVRQFEALVALDPANTDWLYQLAVARIGLLEILASAGSAQGLIPVVAADIAQLLAIDPAKPDWNCALRGRLLAVQASGGERNKGAAVMAPLQRYVTEMQALTGAGKTLTVEQARVVAKAEILLGELLAADPAGQAPTRAQARAQARTLWQSAAARLAASTQVGEYPSLTLLAQAQFRLGDIDAAQAMAETLKASAYRHPDYTELQRLLHPSGNLP